MIVNLKQDNEGKVAVKWGNGMPESALILSMSRIHTGKEGRANRREKTETDKEEVVMPRKWTNLSEKKKKLLSTVIIGSTLRVRWEEEGTSASVYYECTVMNHIPLEDKWFVYELKCNDDNQVVNQNLEEEDFGVHYYESKDNAVNNDGDDDEDDDDDVVVMSVVVMLVVKH